MTLARIALALAVVLPLGLAACGVKGDPERPMPQDQAETESEG